MSYATLDDLMLRLSNCSGVYIDTGGAVMTAEATADLAAAQAEIDGMIGTRYVVPVTAGPALPLLKSWTITLAEELAWSRTGKSELPKNVVERVAVVRRNLERIASGGMVLSGAAQDDVSGGGSVVCIDGSPPVFGREKMRGY